MRTPRPLSERRLDLLILLFYGASLLLVSAMLHFEQLVIATAEPFRAGLGAYPSWPPEPVVRAIHDYAFAHDPLLAARPPWWRAFAFWDCAVFAPFYLVAIYAWATGKEWIRPASIAHASVMLVMATTILAEQSGGLYPTPSPEIVLPLYGTFVFFPLVILMRLSTSPFPFSRPPARRRDADGHGAFPAEKPWTDSPPGDDLSW